MQTPLTREHSPLRDLTLYSVVALLCVLAWDYSGLDYPVMQALGNAQGFALKTNWWLEEILHTKARQLSGVVLAVLVLMVWWPRGWFRHLSRLQRIEIVMGVLWCLLCISSLKRISLTSCPWDLQDFGGPAVYVSHWRWGVADGGAGHCFPGGHASSALAFLALCLPWLTNATVADRRRGRAQRFAQIDPAASVERPEGCGLRSPVEIPERTGEAVEVVLGALVIGPPRVHR